MSDAGPGPHSRSSREIDVDRWFAPIPVSAQVLPDQPPARTVKATRVTVPAAKRAAPPPRRITPLLAGAVASVVLAAGALGVGAGFLLGGNKAETTSPPTTSVAAPASAPAPPGNTPAGPCDGLAGALVTSGAGNRDSAVGAVAAFEYAYYVDRNPPAALALTTPEAKLDLAALTVSIGTLPPGTQHCVAATQTSPTELSVVLVVSSSAKRSMHRQVVTVTPGRPYTITGFRES